MYVSVCEVSKGILDPNNNKERPKKKIGNREGPRLKARAREMRRLVTTATCTFNDSVKKHGKRGSKRKKDKRISRIE